MSYILRNASMTHNLFPAKDPAIYEEFGPEHARHDAGSRLPNAKPIDIRLWITNKFPDKPLSERVELESLILLYLSETEFLPI